MSGLRPGGHPPLPMSLTHRARISGTGDVAGRTRQAASPLVFGRVQAFRAVSPSAGPRGTAVPARLSSKEALMHHHTTSGPAGLSRTRPVAVLLLVLAMAVALFGGRAAASGPPAQTTAAVQPAAASSLPCDIYAAGGTPCIAAHSTTRALFAAY